MTDAPKPPHDAALVAELREQEQYARSSLAEYREDGHRCGRAADEIERLGAEVARLRESRKRFIRLADHARDLDALPDADDYRMARFGASSEDRAVSRLFEALSDLSRLTAENAAKDREIVRLTATVDLM